MWATTPNEARMPVHLQFLRMIYDSGEPFDVRHQLTLETRYRERETIEQVKFTIAVTVLDSDPY